MVLLFLNQIYLFFVDLIFAVITYFSVGLSDDWSGGRFFTFYFVVLLFGIAISQYVRLIASLTQSISSCGPICQLSLVIMILFSGYMIAPINMNDGLVWIYWINPLAYALKGILLSFFLAVLFTNILFTM